jgi:hypothetical protein
MFSENWGGTAMKVVQFFNTDNWKNNLCNPDVSVLGGNDQDSGNIISCSTGNCIPILTMAAERQEFVTINNSHYYMYTIAYYLGPVILKNGNSLSYNVEFRGSGATIKGYVKTQMYVKNNDVIRVAKVFAHVKQFTQMCIVFNGDYPPDDLGGKTEYCRDIKTDDFNTGSPYVDLTNQAYGYTTVANQPAKIFTGVVKAQEPGVLDP